MIGCGALGRIHIESVARIPAAHFVAFCDVNRAAAEACLQEFGGRYATDEVDRILEDSGIDAIYICTRHDSHASLAIAAARAKKHIFIEKPLALTLEECEAISEAVTLSGIYLMPAFKMRFYPLVQRAKAFIPNPQLVLGQMMDNRWPDAYWAQDPVQGGANVLSQGCHTTDIMRYFAGGDLSTVLATGGAVTHPGHPCLDLCVATIRFSNGVLGSWVQGDIVTPPLTSKFFFEVFGDGRSVQLYDRLKKAVFFDGKESWVEERPEEEGFYLENVEFIEAIRENRQPSVTVHDGIQATRMVLEAERSIRGQSSRQFAGAAEGRR